MREKFHYLCGPFVGGDQQNHSKYYREKRVSLLFQILFRMKELRQSTIHLEISHC